MKNFSDYAKEQNKNGQSGNFGNGGNGGNGGESPMEMIRRIAAQYEGAGETEIINAIMAEAAKSKAQGTLSDADIDNFAAMIEPMLNSTQRKQLRSVIEKLKKS